MIIILYGLSTMSHTFPAFNPARGCAPSAYGDGGDKTVCSPGNCCTHWFGRTIEDHNELLRLRKLTAELFESFKNGWGN